MSLTSRKVVLIGNSGSGKTKALKEIKGESTTNYIHTPTLGVQVRPVKSGTTVYNIWDTAGDRRFRGLGDGHYINADMFIVCTGGNANSPGAKTPAQWTTYARNVCPNATFYYIHNVSGASLASVLV